MKIVKFNNGNFNVRRESGDDMHLVCAVCNSAELDFDIIEECVSLGNACVGTELYNYNTARYYMVTPDDFKQWCAGFVVKLRGYTKGECHV